MCLLGYPTEGWRRSMVAPLSPSPFMAYGACLRYDIIVARQWRSSHKFRSLLSRKTPAKKKIIFHVFLNYVFSFKNVIKNSKIIITYFKCSFCLNNLFNTSMRKLNYKSFRKNKLIGFKNSPLALRAISREYN